MLPRTCKLPDHVGQELFKLSPIQGEIAQTSHAENLKMQRPYAHSLARKLYNYKKTLTSLVNQLFPAEPNGIRKTSEHQFLL
jgi:hypothetical protein